MAICPFYVRSRVLGEIGQILHGQARAKSPRRPLEKLGISVLNTGGRKNSLHKKILCGLGEQEMRSKLGKQVHSRRL